MLVVHGFWSATRGLCLWAEDSQSPVTSPSQAVRSARPHPFAAAPADLSDAVPGLTGAPGTATLLLPSTSRSPLDSPEVPRLRPRRESGKPPILLPWTVPVVRVDPRSALDVLDLPIIEARYGVSMHHLADIAAFARDLAERGRVLPDVQPGDEHTPPQARWRPVLQGPDVVVAAALSAALPPVCRAEAPASGDPAGQSPTALVGDATATFTDAVVRRRLESTRLPPPRRGRRPRRMPPTDAWLLALTSPVAEFEATPNEVAALAEALAPWAQFGAGPAGPARLTFRLAEPDSDSALGDLGDSSDSPAPRWRLEFWLQSAQDPTLLVAAEQVWSGGDGLARWLSRPDELLLAELGRASTIYPALIDALHTSHPDALALDLHGTHDFLTCRAALLDQAGFGVLLPAWWSHRQRLGLRGSASTPTDSTVTGGRFGRDSLVDFAWQLAVGDEALTDEELAALAATKAPLVRLRGQWVVVDPDQLQRGLDFLARQAARPSTVGEVIALATRHPDDLDTPLPVMAIHADGPLGDLLTGSAERTLQPLATPDGFHADLRPYQTRGLSWLAFLADLGLGACLADDMGLGKTIQLLALESHQRSERPVARPTLLLCPMSLVGNWQREAARFAPHLRLYPHHGRERCHGTDLADHLATADLVVTTYHTATRDIDELAAYDWERLVLDEAQAVKNSQSRAARAVRRLPARHRVALTGTPMENRLSELWAIMDVLNPGILGSAEKFRARYAVPIERHGETEPAGRLRTITRPYLLRRVKTDPTIIDDLPEKIEITQHYRLTIEQAALYQSVVDEMMRRIETSTGIERRGNVLAAMTKLKQVCNHPAQLLHDHSPVGRRSGKVTRLEEIVEEILAEGDKALLFTQYTDFAELLLPHLSARFDTEILYLHGGTSKQRRDELVTRFQSDDGPPLFLLSLKAGGTGLNLTAANHVIHLDRWWNPAVENQATDRAFRIGQKRRVQVRKFVCVGTLEEKIDAMIEDKKALANMVVTDGEGWLTELSTGALRDLFALAGDATDE